MLATVTQAHELYAFYHFFLTAPMPVAFPGAGERAPPRYEPLDYDCAGKAGIVYTML